MSNDDSDQDQRQLILPHVDTSTSVRGRTLREWMGFIPAGIAYILAGVAVLAGSLPAAAALVVVAALPLTILGIHIESELSEAWYLTPRGLMRDYLSYRRLRRELPFGAEAAELAALHGVRSVCPDGSLKRHDGSRLAILGPIDGTNTDRLLASTTSSLAKSLTDGVDEELGPMDQWWSFYSTTRPATSDPHAVQREQRAEDYQNDLDPDQREIVEDTAGWLRDRDAEKNANDWQHYVVVEVHPENPEVSLPNDSIGERVSNASASARQHLGNCGRALASLSASVRGTEDEGDEQTETDSTESPPAHADESDEETEGKSLEDVLDERVQLVKQAISRPDQVEVERADPAEHIEVLRSFWTDKGTEIGDAADGSAVNGGTGSLLRRAFQRELGDDGTTPTERLLKPSHFDVDGDTVKLGNNYTRTFWISEWPIRPGAMFLDDLYNYGGVDLDVKVHATPLDRYAAADSIEEKGLDIGAEAHSRRDDSDFGAMSVGSAREAYEDAYNQLYNTNTSAWYLNGYVTVRAGDSETLNDACKHLTRRLEADPAACAPEAPSTNQRAALASASPTGIDKYAEETNGERRHIALSGAFGAMFPFGSADFSEPDGIFWGRDRRTGNAVVANPYKRGASSHLFSTGKSRAGKTTFFKDRGTDWYLNGDDRTLIMADTESEFRGVTDVCGGERIKIGANDPLNPLHIEPVSEERQQEAGGDIAPLTSHIDFMTELTMSLIRVGLPAQYATIDPSLYKIARYGFGKTYERAGITNKLDTHDRASPVYDDFFDVVEDISNNPAEHTIRGTEMEREARKRQAGELLESLVELMENGRYDHLRVSRSNTGTTSLLNDDVRMAYLDMPHLSGSSDAEKSIGLQIALSQISQKIKRAPGRTLFGLDEAHVLYQSEQTVDWLQSAARRWARYNAAMWSISQSPKEFVKQIDSASTDQENKRQTVLEQSSTQQAFHADKQTTEQNLSDFGMNAPQINAAKNSLTPGREASYSEHLVHFADSRGWIECEVKTSPVMDAIEAAEAAYADESSETETLGVTEIEGIGDTYGERLQEHGVETPTDLIDTDPQTVAAVTGAAGSRIDEWQQSALVVNANGTTSASQPAADGGQPADD
jgi:hypothetical protein